MAQAEKFGRYTLTERIGLGGMAEIFRATTTGPGGFEMELCIKRILPHCSADADFVRMFIDEARLAARLRHANIVQIIDFDVVDERYYIAMELVEGKDLKTLLATLKEHNQTLGAARAVSIAADIARALHYAHSRRDKGQALEIVHRDVSPHNVLLSLSGEVKLSDFGIAKAASRLTHTGTGVVKGKVAYMAPEQAMGKASDHRIDQFATGLILYEMLCGERAYQGDSQLEVLQLAMQRKMPSIRERMPELPEVLLAIVERATAADPAQRYPSMYEMEQALRQSLFVLHPSPEQAELAPLMERLFGAELPRRPKTEILPALEDLPPFDDDAESGDQVWDDSQKPAPSTSLANASASEALLQAMPAVDGRKATEPESIPAVPRADAEPALPADDKTQTAGTGLANAPEVQIVAAEPEAATLAMALDAESLSGVNAHVAELKPTLNERPGALAQPAQDLAQDQRCVGNFADPPAPIEPTDTSLLATKKAPPPWPVRVRAWRPLILTLVIITAAVAAMLWVLGGSGTNRVNDPTLALADASEPSDVTDALVLANGAQANAVLDPAHSDAGNSADGALQRYALGNFAVQLKSPKTDAALVGGQVDELFDDLSDDVKTDPAPKGDLTTARGAPQPKTAPTAASKKAPAADRRAKTRKKVGKKATGRLILLVRDSWAEVFLGKRKIGVSPLDAAVPVGQHRLHLINPEIPLEKYLPVTIKADQTTRLITTLRDR